MASKAEEKNYRIAEDPDHSCKTCMRKQAVPWLWCDEIGKAVCTSMTCDRQLEVEKHV